MAGTDDAHRRGATVLFVVGVQDEQDVHRSFEYGVDVVLGAHFPHHVEKVGRVGQIVVRVVERLTNGEPVAHRSNGRHLRDESQDLLVSSAVVVDVFGAFVEGSECRNC